MQRRILAGNVDNAQRARAETIARAVHSQSQLCGKYRQCAGTLQTGQAVTPFIIELLEQRIDAVVISLEQYRHIRALLVDIDQNNEHFDVYRVLETLETLPEL
jgi:hypothetical protein